MTASKRQGDEAGREQVAWLRRVAAELRLQAKRADTYADAWVGKPEDVDATGIYARGEAYGLRLVADRLDRRANKLARLDGRGRGKR